MAETEDPSTAGDAAERIATHEPARPAPSQEGSTRGGRLRRWARRLAWAGFFVALALVALFLSRDHLLHPALCRIATWAGARAGYEVRLDVLRTDWWSELSLEGVGITAADGDGALRALELDRAHASFSVPRLLRSGLDGLSAVALGSGRVELDLRSRQESRPAPGGRGSLALPATIPRLTAEAVTLRLVTDAGALAIDELGAATPEEAYELVANRVSWSGGVNVAGPCAVDVVWNPDGTALFRGLEIDAVVRGGTGEVDLSRLAEGALTGSASFELPEAGNATARFSFADGSFALQLEESHLALAPTVSAVAALGLPTPGLDSLVGVANLRGEMSAGAGGLEVRAQLEGRDVGYDGRRVDELLAEATIRTTGIRFARVEARAGNQRVVVTDSNLPFTDLLAGLSGAVEVDVDDLRYWLRGAPDPNEAPSAAAEELPPHRLVVRGEVGDGRVRLDEGQLDVAGGHVDLRAGVLDLAPVAAGEQRLELDLSVDLPRLSALGELFGATDWEGSLSGEVRLTGPLAAPVGRAQLEGTGVAIAGLRLGGLVVDAEADGEEIRIARLSALSDVLRAEASGVWQLRTERLAEARLELDLGGLEAFGFERGGSLSAVARLDGPWSRPTGTVTLTGSNLAIAGTPLEDVALDARADEGFVTVSRAIARTPYGELSLTGAGTATTDGRVEFELDSLVAAAGDQNLQLTAPVTFTRDAAGFVLGTVELAGSAGRLRGEARLDGGTWAGQLETHALRLDAFLASLLPAGTSTGEIDASLSTGENASIVFSARSSGILVATDALPATLSLDGRWADDAVELSSLSVALDGREILRAQGRVPLPHLQPDAPLALEARAQLSRDFPVSFPLRGEVARLTGDAEATVSLAGTWRSPRGSVSVTARELALDPRALGRPFLEEPARLDVELELGEVLDLTRLELQVPGRLIATGSGKLTGPLDLARAAGGDLTGLRAAIVNAKGIVTIPDPSWAAELLGARRVGGLWRTDVSVRGPLGAPRLEGNVSVQAGSIKFAGVPELEQVALDLQLSSAGVEIREARGELGSAPVTLSGSVANDATGPVFDLALEGSNVLLQRSSRLRLRGDLALALAGTADALALSGDVHLVNSRFLQQIDILSILDVRRSGGVSSAQRGLVLPSFREGPLATMRLDVDVDTREPLSLLGNVARGKIGLDLHIGGTGEVVVPTGVVFLDEGRVALPGGPMRFERGLVTFREEDPYVPRLDLSGEARLAGYDLELRVEGPVDDLQIEPTAFPPLERRDALLLVLTGRVPPSGEATGTAAQSLGLYLAKDLARRWATRPSLSDEGDEGLLDRLQLISGQDVSRSGVMTLEVSYRAFDEVLVDSDSIFVVAERDVYEDYNIGLRFMFRSR